MFDFKASSQRVDGLFRIEYIFSGELGFRL